MSYGMNSMNPMMMGMYGVGPAMNAASDDPDLYAQFQSDRNKQLIANLLLAHGQQQPQGQMVGRFYVPPSPLQGLGNIASTAAGIYGLHQADQDRMQGAKTLKEQRQAQLQQALSQMSKDLSPTTKMPVEQAGPGAPVPTGEMQPVAPPLPGGLGARGRPGMTEEPVMMEGPRPTSVQDVPKSREEILDAQMQYLTHARPELREAMKFKLQQDQQSQENALNREARSADAITKMERDLALATAMGANKEALAQMRSDLDKARIDEMTRHNKMMESIQSNKVSAVDAPKPPAGYRFMKDGNLEAIPGGPADTKLQGAFNQDTAQLQSSTSNFDRLASTANSILKHPGLAGITGIRGKVPDVPGTDAANARALLQTLKSQVAFDVLQDMRNNSKTGGALGNVSDAEGKRLENNLAALDTTQGIDQFKKQLAGIIEFANSAKDRLHDAYNMKHKGVQAPSSGGGLTPAEQQELDQLRKRFGK